MSEKNLQSIKNKNRHIFKNYNIGDRLIITSNAEHGSTFHDYILHVCDYDGSNHTAFGVVKGFVFGIHKHDRERCLFLEVHLFGLESKFSGNPTVIFINPFKDSFIIENIGQ